ncbi:hypothetical protein CK203_057923 [Vitis vinifera]|uniref:DUF7746 domain-containing protein n=1 Tax=Vitis vinifera TaxID=29760 RepID=A0A438GMN0_VITVI|nr:hypothetical protein CK203_057923 [Vitis vinifera]
MSRRSSDSQDTVVNSEEINYPKIQNDLDDWKLPKVSNQEIYKKGTFKFFTDYTIKTSEMTVSLEQDDQVIRLLDNRSVEKHKKDGYNFIHFGMIQVAAKPLTRLGLNTAIVMCLRDNRHLEYRDSIIGAVQAGLNDGPVYFQCYPNFTVRLRDADILDSVVLHIKTHGFKIKPGNSPVSIITRFAYKSMNTSVGSGALCTSPKGETTYFHSDMLDKSDFIIPKKILWKDVDFPENWHFANAVPAIAQRSENIPAALEFLFMNPLELQALPSQLEPLGRKGSSSGNPKNVKLTGVRSYTNVARPFYSEENESTQESQQDESPVMSPTYSQMINTISLSDEDFEINKDLLRKDFYSEVNKQRNDWFFSTVLRNYYPRPTFPDMQFEERNQYTQASYTSGTIYEWNIDGMTEYNILTKLQEMTMVSLRVGGIIISLDDKNSILKAYRINESNEVVKDEDGQDIEDAVATLIYSISKHFIGDPAKIKDKTADLLTNLKIKIREQYNGQIPYDKLTYGEIISIVTGEGIKLCNDFKLKQQMKNEQKIYKNEFGSFCSQFGFSQKKLCLPLSKTKFDQQSPKDVSIKELHEEVKQHKKEIKELRLHKSRGYLPEVGNLPYYSSQRINLSLIYCFDLIQEQLKIAFKKVWYLFLYVKRLQFWPGLDSPGDYIIITDESAAFPSLGRTFKTKWWDALKNDASTDAVKQYFLKNPSQVSASDDMSQFLLKKQQLQAMLAAAKTPQEFQKILDEGSFFPRKFLCRV